jgi:hypothetical protein
MTGYSPNPSLNIPGPGMGELVGTQAIPWRIAMSNAALGTGPAHLIFRGDSIVQGYLATVYTNGLGTRVDTLLRAAISQTGNATYFPVSTNVNYAAAMAYGVAGGALIQVMDSGFAGEATYLTTTSVITSPTVNPSTGFWIHCQKGPGVGAGFTYQVNGGAVQGPVTAGAAPRKGGRIWDHGNAGGLVAGGANTVVITGNAGLGSVVEGITFFNLTHNTTRPQGFITQANASTGTGLRTWVAGHFGVNTSYFSVGGFSSPVTGTPASTALMTDPNEFIVPHAIVTMLGINDSTLGFSAQTFMANIRTMVAMDRAAATAYGYTMPLQVFAACYGSTNDPTNLYLGYAKALKDYCSVNGFMFIDLSALMGSIVGVASISADNIHPNDAGHNMIATYIAQALRDA